MFAVALSCTLALGQSSGVDNLDFRAGTLGGWEGQGFYLTTGTPRGPHGAYGVCSSDAASPTRTGMLRYVFTVPRGASMLRFRAFAAVRPGLDADSRLDIVLAAADNRPLPRQVRSAGTWTAAPRLLPRWQGKPREYCWDLAGQEGQTMQVVLIDRDDRPGHYIYAAGFRFDGAQDFHDHDFASFMVDLQQRHNLPLVNRYDSRRFTAISNASEAFTVERLRNCEVFYDQFLDHFRAKGFEVYPPRQRLMLAVFDAPAGFEAYLGRKMPPAIVGIYHTPTNRLVLYDLAENRALVANKDKALKQGSKIEGLLERSRFIGAVERKARDASQDANLSTTMHEAAHLIAFNCGLLNREADSPCWLVEGMASYCEVTDQGDWVSLGAMNRMRLHDLTRARGDFIPLLELIQSDDWRNDRRVLVGYAQSWALFRLLLNERPEQLRAYLGLIYQSRGPEQRLSDFRQAFGNDLAALETRYRTTMERWIRTHGQVTAR